MDKLEVLYGGAAGGGKSDALILAAMQYADVPGYSAILFRRTFADLAGEGAIMQRAHAWLRGMEGVRWSSADKSFFFETAWTQTHLDSKRNQLYQSGDEYALRMSDDDVLDLLGPPERSRLSFGYLDNSNDKYRYQGWEFQFVGFDELTQHPEANYKYLFSRLRRLEGMPVPLRMRAATNPGGQYGQWVLDHFIPREYLEADEDTQFSNIWSVTDPCSNCEGSGKFRGEVCEYCEGTGGEERYFIPARLEDNPSLDKLEYDRSLRKLGAVDRARLKHGRWDVNEEGGLFKQEWFQYYSRRGTHFIVQKPDSPELDVAPLDKCTVFVTADTASKDKTTADYTVICAWALHEPTGWLFLLDCYRDKLEVPSIAPEVYKMAFKHDALFVMIEDASSGTGVIQQLRRGIKSARDRRMQMRYTVRGFNPGNTDKVSRSTVAQIKMENGEVFFPADSPFWLTTFCTELLMFGSESCDHDDQVDNLTMASWYADGKCRDSSSQSRPSVVGGMVRTGV